jgi:hypothetical protein
VLHSATDDLIHTEEDAVQVHDDVPLVCWSTDPLNAARPPRRPPSPYRTALPLHQWARRESTARSVRAVEAMPLGYCC